MRGLAILVACLVAHTAPAFACAVDPYSYSAYPGSLTVAANGNIIGRAWFDGPAEIYDHFVLGRDHEPTVLYLQFVPVGLSSDCGSAISAGQDHVFEDIAPRLADLTGDALNEVIVVRSGGGLGAQLAVYGVQGDSFGLIAATAPLPHHRWLAPAGIADFDGDGRIEIAYVDRPHLRRELVFVRLERGRLVEIARLPGVTNHRIGDDFISGGLRNCGQGPELVAANADWSRLLVIGWQDGPMARDVGAWSTGLPKGRWPASRERENFSKSFPKFFEEFWRLEGSRAYSAAFSPCIRRSAFLRTRTDRKSCIARRRASVTSSSCASLAFETTHCVVRFMWSTARRISSTSRASSKARRFFSQSSITARSAGVSLTSPCGLMLPFLTLTTAISSSSIGAGGSRYPP